MNIPYNAFLRRSASEMEVARLKSELSAEQSRLAEAIGLAKIAQRLDRLTENQMHDGNMEERTYQRGRKSYAAMQQNGHEENQNGRMSFAGFSQQESKDKTTSRGGEKAEQIGEADFAKERRALHRSLERKLRSLQAIYAAQKADLEELEPGSYPLSEPEVEEGDLDRLAHEVEQARDRWEQACVADRQNFGPINKKSPKKRRWPYTEAEF
jgi:hypothetical protein